MKRSLELLSRVRHAAVLAAALTIGSMSLGAVTLESLIGTDINHGLVVGDKTFYNFSFTPTCAVGGVGTSCSSLVSSGLLTGINTGEIQITGDNGNSFPGLIGFNFTDSLKVISDGANNVTVDIGFLYNAAVTTGNQLITDVHLLAADTRNPSNASTPPSVTIGESVFNAANGNFLGNLQVTDPPPVLSASVILSTPVSAIRVIKDINLQSGAGMFNGTAKFASMTSMAQLLSQSAVPEPKTVALMFLTMLGLAIYQRRRLA